MYDWTQAAAEYYAQSHRGFKVGAMVIAYDLPRGRLGIFFGANRKPQAAGNVNEHAEQVAIEKALQRGYTLIAAIVIFGPVQADTQSGHQSDTLHPCGLCRAYMTGVAEICPDRTRIYTFASEDVTETFSLRELMALHGEPCNVATRPQLDAAPKNEVMVWQVNPDRTAIMVPVPADVCRCPILNLGDWCPVHQSRLNPFL
jgi:cytidine deaminase